MTELTQKPRPFRVTLQALGCRTNQYEAEALGSMFAERGWEVVSSPPWDLGIVLSCAVTAVAERKSRTLLRRFSRLSPGCGRILSSCYAQNLLRTREPFPEADLVVGNRIKHRIPLLAEALLRGEPLEQYHELPGPPGSWTAWDDLQLSRLLWHTRGFVKIQEGCQRFCSYCIISRLRGKPVSRPEEEIMKEVTRLAAAGCGEVVLTGIHLGSYGGEGEGEPLGSLVQKISRIAGVKRIRFGSLEPFSITPALLTMLQETPEFCPHFHIPLQSGDDGVLERMKRGHTAVEFARLISMVRRIFGEDIHVSTDLLIGFPGEDEKAFERTIKLSEELGFGKLHVFPFSPREGTPAFSWPRPSRKETEERCSRAALLGEKLLGRYASRWLGRTVEVLAEKQEPSEKPFFQGHTPHFLLARFPGRALPGEERSGRVAALSGGDLLCEPLEESLGIPFGRQTLFRGGSA